MNHSHVIISSVTLSFRQRYWWVILVSVTYFPRSTCWDTALSFSQVGVCHNPWFWVQSLHKEDCAKIAYSLGKYSPTQSACMRLTLDCVFGSSIYRAESQPWDMWSPISLVITSQLIFVVMWVAGLHAFLTSFMTCSVFRCGFTHFWSVWYLMNRRRNSQTYWLPWKVFNLLSDALSSILVALRT